MANRQERQDRMDYIQNQSQSNIGIGGDLGMVTFILASLLEVKMGEVVSLILVYRDTGSALYDAQKSSTKSKLLVLQL